MQQIPPLARTNAPPSKAYPLRNSSLITEAVRPAPVVPFPEMNLALGAA